MRRLYTHRRPSLNDRRDTRRFILIITLIALAACILLAALFAPAKVPLHVLWPPIIALITVAVRLYLRPPR
ncbi:MAG TPA: hypothetical protein PKD53_03055 [Chloroflexaceae bacterium]|nr:hypothetical protein [Chloroflexaceae bacterium]